MPAPPAARWAPGDARAVGRRPTRFTPSAGSGLRRSGLGSRPTSTKGREHSMTQARRTEARLGGHILADALVAQGVTHAFACRARATSTCSTASTTSATASQLVTCRFEAGAVHMAEAYGKLTGKPGVAIVTRGPGACHAAIGVHVAFQDSTPLVLIVGQIPFEETDRESFQEVDYRQMFAPAGEVGDADRRRRAHPRTDGACLRRRGQRPARPGGGRDSARRCRSTSPRCRTSARRRCCRRIPRRRRWRA